MQVPQFKTNQSTHMRKVIFTLLALMPLFLTAQEKIYAPALTSPTDAAVDQAANALLNWNAVAGAVKYQVYIDSAADFSSAIQMLTVYTAIYNTYLDFGTTYYWKVRAIDAANDTSFWSATRSFTTRSTVILTTPADSVNNLPVHVVLGYTPIAGVSLYEYELDTNNTFSSSYYRTGVVTASGVVGRLDYGQRYFYRYRAMHMNDTSDWCVERTFTTKDTIKIKLPAVATVNYQPTDSIKWSSIVGSKFGQYEIDTDPSFSSPELFQTDTTRFYIKQPGTGAADTIVRTRLDSTLLFGTTYYWRARVGHPRDTSEWSAAGSFTTIDIVTLELPADDAIDVSCRPKFEWRAIRGTRKYELQYDVSSGFTSPVSVITTDSSHTILSNIQSQEDYYWRVRCYGAADTTDWGNVYHFKTTWGVGIEETQQAYSVYPNPTSGDLYIQLSSTASAYAEVMNLLGEQVIAPRVLVSGSNYINLTHLHSGVYFLKVNIDGQITTSRIILR